eukprot:scaffold13967_cov32-Tisochrysis_lutea.AAC.2
MGKAERGRSSTWGGIRTPLQKAVALFTPSKSGGGGHADGGEAQQAQEHANGEQPHPPATGDQATETHDAQV